MARAADTKRSGDWALSTGPGQARMKTNSPFRSGARLQVKGRASAVAFLCNWSPDGRLQPPVAGAGAVLPASAPVTSGSRRSRRAVQPASIGKRQKNGCGLRKAGRGIWWSRDRFAASGQWAARFAGVLAAGPPSGAIGPGSRRRTGRPAWETEFPRRRACLRPPPWEREEDPIAARWQKTEAYALPVAGGGRSPARSRTRRRNDSRRFSQR